tara:strand:+ start:40 stop:258 length:219 start_codon:yes stop_codon:yes gene_type:complete
LIRIFEILLDQFLSLTNELLLSLTSFTEIVIGSVGLNWLAESFLGNISLGKKDNDINKLNKKDNLKIFIIYK